MNHTGIPEWRLVDMAPPVLLCEVRDGQLYVHDEGGRAIPSMDWTFVTTLLEWYRDQRRRPH